MRRVCPRIGVVEGSGVRPVPVQFIRIGVGVEVGFGVDEGWS